MTKDNKLVFPCLPFPRIVPVSTSVKNGPFPKASFNTALVELRNDAKELLKNWNRLGSLKETPPNSEQWGRKTEEWGSVQREGRDIWVHFLHAHTFFSMLIESAQMCFFEAVTHLSIPAPGQCLKAKLRISPWRFTNPDTIRSKSGHLVS